MNKQTAVNKPNAMQIVSRANLRDKLQMFISMRERVGWSRNIGAGWVKEDIKDLNEFADQIRIHFSDRTSTIKLDQMNLRELDACKEWLEDWHESTIPKNT